MKEIWKPVYGYEQHYSVSNVGRIRRELTVGNTKKGRILKPRIDHFGYQVLCLSKNNVVKLCKMHKIVMNSFIGLPPENMNVNHKNRIKHDNKLINLEYVTQSYNVKHAYNTGHKSSFGMSHGMSKLTDKQVINMRNLYTNGYRITRISEIFNINRLTVSDAVRKITWRHIC